MSIELSLEGMRIDQLITMLQAGQAQGATKVAVGMRVQGVGAVQSDIEWLSMAPVGDTIYLGAMLEQGDWQTMSNEAADGLDW